MLGDILEVNGFSIIINVTEIIPPMAIGKYEAKVTKIYDHQNKQELLLTPDNNSFAWGRTEEEAYRKALDKIQSWAEKQR